MQSVFEKLIVSFKKTKSFRRKLVCIILVLSIFVTIGVVWKLKFTGLTMSGKATCGFEEHVHSDACIDPACLEPVTEKILSCALEQHTHADECYSLTDVLNCEEDHEHTEECYKQEKVLTCEISEHIHTEECYTTEEIGTKETVYICGKSEHTHTVMCYSDPEADVETKAQWESSLPALTGDTAKDLAAIAQSQLGYTESELNYQVDDSSEIKRGYTRYGAWYGNEYGDWNAMFVSFCVHYAGISSSAFPYSSGCYSWMTALEDSGNFCEFSTHKPAAGDIVFLDAQSSGRADTVGVVVEANDISITAIIGDSDNKVERNVYSISANTICGYGILQEKHHDEPESVTADSSDDDVSQQPATEEQPIVEEEPVVEEETTAQQDTTQEDAAMHQEPIVNEAPPIPTEEPVTEDGSDSAVPPGTISLRNMLTGALLIIDGETIPVWTSGEALNVNAEQNCRFLLSFNIGNAVKTGDYYKYAYQIPSNIMSLIDIETHNYMPFFGVVGGDGSGEGGTNVYMGTYSINDRGLIVLTFDDTFASSYVDIKVDDFTVGFEWKEDTGTNPVRLVFNEDYVFLLNIIQSSVLLTQKTVSRSSSDPLTGNFTVRIESFGDANSVSAKDTLIGTYTYKDSDNVEHTIDVLEYHAGDIVEFRILASDGTYRDLTGRADLDPNDSTTALYTITAADAAAGTLSNLPEFDLLTGDTLEFTYQAHIREEAAALADINVKTVSGRNEVLGLIGGADDEYPASASLSYAGKKTQLLTKSAMSSQDDSSITWFVDINNACIYNVNGMSVYDNIDSFQSYDTASPFIVRTYNKSGALLNTQYVDWSTVLSQDGMSWQYVINDAATHKYTIEYTTLIDDSYTGAEPIKNGANGRFLDCWYYTPSGGGPHGGIVVEVGQRDYEYTKSGDSPAAEDQYIDWTATFQVNPNSVSPKKFLVYDTLPAFKNANDVSDVVQLVDDSGNVVNLIDGSVHDIDGIIDMQVYKLINGTLVYDANGNITNTAIVIPGFNDGETPMKVGINEVNGPFVNGKPAGFRITKTGRKPAVPQTNATLSAAGYDLPGTFGDYSDGYAIVIKYRTTSEIGNAPNGSRMINNVKYYFGDASSRLNVEASATAILPVTTLLQSVGVEKNGVWNSNEDKIHYTVKINDGMASNLNANTLTWVDTYDENLELTDYITLYFADQYKSSFPTSATSSTHIIIGSAIKNTIHIPVSGFVETSAGSGVFQYVFERLTHCGAISDPSKWVTVSITWDKNNHTITYEFDDIPTDKTTGRQQNWRIDYFMTIVDPDATFYGPRVLENTFEVFGDSTSTAVGVSTSTTSIERKQVDKTCVQDGSVFNFKVEVDYNQTLENFTEITFNDVMNDHLDLVFSSVEVKYQLPDGTTVPVQDAGVVVTKNFTSGTGVLNIVVKAGEEGTAFSEVFGNLEVEKLVLTYNCMVVGALIGESVEISNSITVDGLTYNSDEYHQIVQVPYVDCIGSGTPLVFSVLKIDGDAIVGENEIPLAGSVFTLYDITDKSNPTVITTRTSGTDGKCVFASEDIVTEVAGFSLNTLTPYRLVETTAPDGYVRTTTQKDFFIYSNSDLTDGVLTLTNAQQALLDGCTAYYISSLETIEFTCTNVHTTSFNILKKDAATESVISDRDAKFTLYRDAACTDVYQTTTTVDGKATFIQLQSGTYYLKETEAPAGYSIHEGIYTVVVSESDATGDVQIRITGIDAEGSLINETIESDGYIDFPNKIGFVLPETGGIGVIPVYITGSVLALCALTALLIRKRREESYGY